MHSVVVPPEVGGCFEAHVALFTLVAALLGMGAGVQEEGLFAVTK